MEFPHVDLPVDLIAWTDVTEDILIIYKQSCRLQACIFDLYGRNHESLHQSVGIRGSPE